MTDLSGYAKKSSANGDTHHIGRASVDIPGTRIHLDELGPHLVRARSWGTFEIMRHLIRREWGQTEPREPLPDAATRSEPVEEVLTEKAFV